MFGPSLICRSISASRIPDQFGNVWQYHSRSDRHSKIACWAVAFDLLRECQLLRDHVEDGKVVLGINHRLVDFETGRKKDLDLVIARPEDGDREGTRTRRFADLATSNGIQLSEPERQALLELPDVLVTEVGSVLVALEAKACMTAHVRALPRLHDELDSSHSTTHGNSKEALACGFVMVNAATSFRSTDRNKRDLATSAATENRHRQPADAQRVIDKVGEIRRRAGGRSVGYDAVGLMVVNFSNDGEPMTLSSFPQSPFPYEQMVRRLAHEYSAQFGRI